MIAGIFFRRGTGADDDVVIARREPEPDRVHVRTDGVEQQPNAEQQRRRNAQRTRRFQRPLLRVFDWLVIDVRQQQHLDGAHSYVGDPHIEGVLRHLRLEGPAIGGEPERRDGEHKGKRRNQDEEYRLAGRRSPADSGFGLCHHHAPPTCSHAMPAKAERKTGEAGYKAPEQHAKGRAHIIATRRLAETLWRRSVTNLQ